MHFVKVQYMHFSFCICNINNCFFLPKLSGLACPFVILIDGKIAGVYITVLKLLMDLVIWVLAPMSNTVFFGLISD